MTNSTQFADYLSERELRELLHRRNYVLRYLDRLVEDQVSFGVSLRNLWDSPGIN